MAALSDEDLQKYVGKSVAYATKELESQGYKIHVLRTIKYATPYVPAKVLYIGQDAPPPEKRAIITCDAKDPEEKITEIRQD